MTYYDLNLLTRTVYCHPVTVWWLVLCTLILGVLEALT